MAKALTLQERNAENLRASLARLGVHDLDTVGAKALLRKPDPYTMGKWIMVDENKIKLQVQLNRSFGIDHFVMSFVPKLPVDHTTINGVDTAALEERMKSADWYYVSESASQLEKEYRKIEKIEEDLNQLATSPDGLRIATVLWNNHMPFYTATKPELIRVYEDSSDLYVAKKFSGETSLEQAYAELRDAVNLNPTAALSPDAAISNYLTEKNIVMITEQELSQNKREFGLIGASAAFTEDLIDKMKAGVPKIEHPYTTKNPVTGDESNTVFHLNKSDKNNLYFLNKWDLTVKKFGTEEPVKMSFYNNDLNRIGHVLKNPDKLVTTFTHARSINYLAGRPVLNTHKNQNGRIEKVWDQAFPKEKLLNGKIKERSFHKEYGFDIQKVGEEYRRGIKSLSNPEHAERFYQSLERGNLEKAIFVEKDGKEKPYYVTPNIPVGFLNVYPECSGRAKPLTPEQLAEKGFISQEFAVKVRERMNQMEKQMQRQGVVAEGGLKESSSDRLKGQQKNNEDGAAGGVKENQTQRQTGVSQNSVKEGQTTVNDKKVGENVGKKEGESLGKKVGENVGKKNSQRQKGDDDTGKPKRKLKPKVS